MAARRNRQDEGRDGRDEHYPPIQRRHISLHDYTTQLNRYSAPGIDETQSNFYINPLPVLDFLEHNPIVFNNNYISLDQIRDLFRGIMQNPGYVNFFRGPRDSPGFIPNEIRKLHASPRDKRNKSWLFPYLVSGDSGGADEVLSIPAHDVFDLPIYMMLFILYRLTQFPGRRNRSFSVGFSIGDSAIFPINDMITGRPITVIDGEIKCSDLSKIFMKIIRKFAELLPTNSQATWNGSDESGTRVILQEYQSRNQRIHLKLHFYPAASINHAHGWTPEIEALLQASPVKTALISVKNEADNKCLIYCVIMGLIMKFKPGGGRVFGVNTLMVDASEVYCKGAYLYTDDEPVSVLIRKLTRLLVRPEYSAGDFDGEEDALYQYVRDIDKKAGTMISVTEFREEFSEIEKKLVPGDLCGIDVYGMDFNVNTHIYPLYMSKKRNRTIELLCVTPPTARCSHYCLIINMQRLLHESGGKQFFSCPKCGSSFYHRRLLADHHCPALSSSAALQIEWGYHYSSAEGAAEKAEIVGTCPKCRLCFTTEFATTYHQEHCLMKGQTGYRHVQLKSYDPFFHPTLNGEELDLEKEERDELKRRILYADFESSINPDTGVHSFMSYGVYDWKANKYKCGYKLDEFVEYLVRVAYDNEEDQVYVYFHNAMGYDANFILRYILSVPEYKNWGIQVIMKSMNRLQKLVIYLKQEDGKTKTLHIGDTFLFLTLSLERIVDSIRKDDLSLNQENFERFFNIFHQRYPGVSDEEIDHILRKNIFPYKFFTDSSKLDVVMPDFIRIFRPKKKNLQFFSERVTEDDLRESYGDVQHVVDVFGCRSAKDYHDLYLCCDVMQLADVFNRSMEILWESHHIHLPKYLGMPSASWGAFLRHDPTMRIPLYEDTFFAEFFKAMIRGGITSAALRHAVADERHSIIYLDVNGLYPYVMQAYKFPCGLFTMIPMGYENEEAKVRLEEYFKDFEETDHGMCFCVDLEIPMKVKVKTDMYPFAPEHRRIFKEYYENPDTRELTPFLKKWSDANKGETMQEFTGLVCTLYDKEKYNVHWRLLKFYMEHGVIVKKVYFAVAFEEGDYLAGYIRKNISIRNQRKDELGKTLYKLLGNSIYGKTFESPFKRNTYEIVRDPVKLQGLLSEGNIAAVTPIDELGWIVRMDGEDIILDKPTYIGACVCEFAKLHMYTLLYDKLMDIFPDGCEMVYTDTDSFILRVTHPEGIGSSPEELFAYIKTKDPTLIGGIGGQVKSETGEDDTIEEVIALRSKVYAYKTKKGHLGKRAKGTTHDAQELQLDWETYKSALDSLVSINTKNTQFVRKVFKIATQEVFRQSLSVNDGKRYICEDGIHTHAFGYPYHH